MPQPPDFRNVAETWLRDTRLILSTGRSEELERVDLALESYQANKRPDNLEFLQRSLATWLAAKTPHGAAAFRTRRDKAGAVTRLKRAIDTALQPAEPLPWNVAYPGIFIAHDLYRGNSWVPDDFVGSIKRSLRAIASKPVGQGLLREISRGCAARGKKVIIEYTRFLNMAAPLDDVSHASRRKLQRVTPDEERLDTDALLGARSLLARRIGRVYVHGGGSSAVVCFNHDDLGPPTARRPSFIGLAHELVHAYHYVLGACYRSPCGGIMSGRDTGLMEEEMRTTGVGPWREETPSENAIRAEHGQGRRLSYDPDKDWSHVVPTGPVTRLAAARGDVRPAPPARVVVRPPPRPPLAAAAGPRGPFR